MSQHKTYTLILLYDKMSLSLPVAQALKEKNIEVHVVQNAGELIQSVAAKNVDMVGLSVNHASSRSLVQVLRERTLVKILVFGEDKSSSTAERIDKIDADYKILGVATAYNIWMKIAPSVKAKMKEKENGGNILYGGGGAAQKNEHQAIIVKSGKGAVASEREASKANIVSFSKKKKDKQKNKKTEESLEFGGSDKQQGSSNDLMFFEKEEQKKSSNKKHKKTQKEIDAELDSLEDMFTNSLGAKKPAREIDLDSKEQTGGVTMEQEVPEREGSIIQTGQDDMESSLGQVQRTGQEELEDGNVLQMEKKNKKKIKNKIKKSENEQELGHVTQTEKKEETTPLQPLQDIIQLAAQGTYISVEPGKESFGSINKMTVIPVDRDEERGFIICCTNDNQFLSTIAASMDSFKKALHEKIENEGMVILGESYNIETEEVEIHNWVMENSKFHYMFEDPKSQKQIMICFLPKEIIYPDTNKSSELNMLKVELDVIPPSTPLNFNVFLYLARNKRVIPYIRRGGKFTDEQMARLGEHGVDSIYINEADRKALYSFFISQTIGQDLRPTKKAA